MKSLMMLWNTLAEELGERCGTSTGQDQKTVEARVEGEGSWFLTVTLPDFGKEFERALDQGEVIPSSFQNFKKRGRTPLFLGGFLDLIFDRESGRLVDDPSIDAIHAVRQLSLLFGKMEMPYTAERQAAAMEGFIDCEQDVRRSDFGRNESQTTEFVKVSNLLWSGTLSRIDKVLWEEREWEVLRDDSGPYVHPRHGPGATADRLRGNEKFDLSEWPLRLEEVFPFGEYGIPNARYSYRAARVCHLEPGAERPVRVTSVPKNMKTPRIIAIEPTAVQYMQQGLARVVIDSIHENSLVRGMVGFTDQDVNRRLAREGSLTGNLATLDLSEASDRVSYQLVEAMCKEWPLAWAALDACRSRLADVPGHGVIPLAKFASMGSALTFPIEAMYFLVLVFLGIQKELNRPLTRYDISSLRGRVRVFGDDIIVPKEYVYSVMATLELYGSKVNRSKSFWNGSFRESCGREYYAGEDVSIVRVRKVHVSNPGSVPSLPTSRQFVLETESLVNLRNRFYGSGLWRTAYYLDERIEHLLGGSYPYILCSELGPEGEPGSRSPVLGRWSFLGYDKQVPKDPDLRALHAPLVRGWVVRVKAPDSPVSGEGALHKVLSARTKEDDIFINPTFMAKDHLERTGKRSDDARMNRRWKSPF